MKTVGVVIAVAMVVAVALVIGTREGVLAHDPYANTHTTVTGCASTVAEDWIQYQTNRGVFHIDEYDPKVAKPTGYMRIDTERHLVWFYGPHPAGETPGYVECPPVPPAPPPTPTPTPTVEPAPQWVIQGCRWPSGNQYSSPYSDRFMSCVNAGGIVEFRYQR